MKLVEKIQHGSSSLLLVVTCLYLAAGVVLLPYSIDQAQRVGLLTATGELLVLSPVQWVVSGLLLTAAIVGRWLFISALVMLLNAFSGGSGSFSVVSAMVALSMIPLGLGEVTLAGLIGSGTLTNSHHIVLDLSIFFQDASNLVQKLLRVSNPFLLWSTYVLVERLHRSKVFQSLWGCWAVGLTVMSVGIFVSWFLG